MILIVEDSEDLRDLFRCVLEYGGFTVATAASAQEGLACLLQTPQARLVLLDITLPDMTGLEVAALMKANSALEEIPIVLLSGMPSAQVGDLPLLRKPVDPDALLAATHRYARAG
jgi:CheY-like chemotaxis protein